MVNEEQLRILQSGVDKWNAWREENPRKTVILDGADLSRRDLTGADFNSARMLGTVFVQADLTDSTFVGAELRGANFRGATICAADLRESDCTGASFRECTFRGSDLSGANLTKATLRSARLRFSWLRKTCFENASLRGADLSSSDLSHASLRGAGLRRTNFTSAQLTGVDFFGSKVDSAVFADVDISESVGLTDCQHAGPSTIDHRTLEKSSGIATEFLRGCGLSDDWIATMRSLARIPIEFYSCFISYSHDDKKFARRLHDQLQGRGIRCWLDEKEMLPDDDIYEQVDRGIKHKSD